MLPEEVVVALKVAGALESLGVAYFLGGSMASSMQGEPRSTNDVDIVADLEVSQVLPFVNALGSDFEVDAESLLEAVRLRLSWNIFHLPSALKVDLFVARLGEFDRSELGRRRRVEVAPGSALFVKSPEDTVVRKLLWFREGGGLSDRQWRDVVEVLRVSGSVMDLVYLREWAANVGVHDLLQKAQRDAQPPRPP